MTNLRDITKNLGDDKCLRWQSENEVIVERGVKGPFGWIGWKGAGHCDVRNPAKSGKTYTFLLVSTDLFGCWKSQSTITLIPGTHKELGPYWDDDRHALNFDEKEYDSSDNDNNNGNTSSPWDDFVAWVQANIWLVIGAILLFIFVLWLTFGGGGASLIGAAKH